MYKAIWTGRHGFHILFFLERVEQKRLWAQELDYDHREMWHIVDALLEGSSCVENKCFIAKIINKNMISNCQEGSDYAHLMPQLLTGVQNKKTNVEMQKCKK